MKSVLLTHRCPPPARLAQSTMSSPRLSRACSCRSRPRRCRPPGSWRSAPPTGLNSYSCVGSIKDTQNGIRYSTNHLPNRKRQSIIPSWSITHPRPHHVPLLTAVLGPGPADLRHIRLLHHQRLGLPGLGLWRELRPELFVHARRAFPLLVQELHESVCIK